MYLLSANNNQVYNNQANNITVSAAGTLYGLYFSGNNATVYGNTIHTLSNGGTTFYGLWAAGTITTNCYSNKIYGLSNTNNASTAANILTGIYTSAGATNNIYNNLVGELTAPLSVSPEAIRGIYVNYTTASTNANIYYNSVYINASSTGANFGTTGVFHTTSATSTSGSLTLRNNIIVNKSTAAGTGVVVAYRRSSATTANYNPAKIIVGDSFCSSRWGS